jgi:hypothetical protein
MIRLCGFSREAFFFGKLIARCKSNKP